MEKIVVANWKANLSPETVGAWLDEFAGSYKPSASVRVVLAVPFLCMEQVAVKMTDLDHVVIAAQGVSSYPPGSYTGSTPAAWLRGMAAYALVGHQERRKYFHEGTQSVAGQVRECVSSGIVPIICLDQESKNAQLAALDSSDLEQAMVAYTPADAVRLEVPPATADIAGVVAALSVAVNRAPVLYGGGVTADNVVELMGVDGLAGVMVGRASLNAGGFAQLVNNLA